MKKFSILNIITFIAFSLTAVGTSFASCHDQIDKHFHDDHVAFGALGTFGLAGLAGGPWAWPLVLPAELGIWGYIVVTNNHNHFSEILKEASEGGGPAVQKLYERYQNSTTAPISEADFYKMINQADLDESLCTMNGKIRFPNKNKFVKELVAKTNAAVVTISETDVVPIQP